MVQILLKRVYTCAPLAHMQESLLQVAQKAGANILVGQIVKQGGSAINDCRL